ncbi:MAG: FtsQ-type POTRA domain-containing protein [Geminicoccaceae bacterium]
MRQVSRGGKRDRTAPRQRPRPRWLLPVQLTAAVVALVAVAGVGYRLLDDLGILRRGFAVAGQYAVELSGEAGLVVRKIVIDGDRRTAQTDLAGVLARYRGQNILEVEKGVVKTRIEELPWVRTASVFRRFPDTLVVRLEEYRPMAVWWSEGRRRIVADDGHVIGVDDGGQFRRLPVLAGKNAPARAGELFRLVGTAPELASRVTRATLVGERRWNVWLDRAVEVRLPETGGEEAWRFLAQRQRETGLLARAIDVIDLRHKDWLVLKLMEPPAPPEGRPA